MSLVNTVVISVKNGIAERSDIILLQSDSTRALGLIKGNLQPNNNDERKATEYLKNYVSLHDLSLKVRHVKGHDDSNKSSRSVTNKLCDMRAKEHMYAVRIKFLKREGNT